MCYHDNRYLSEAHRYRPALLLAPIVFNENKSIFNACVPQLSLMDESADALADQQHLFSYAGKVCDLHSGHEDMIGLNSDVSEAYDRISPNEEQVCIPYYDIDTKWRSVTVGNPSQLFNKYDRMSNDGQFIECGVHVGNTECQKRILEICKIEVNPTNDCTTADKYDNGCSQKISQAIKVPEEPFLLFLSHFETCVPFSRVSDLVERTFEQFPEISYEFVAEECMVSDILS